MASSSKQQQQHRPPPEPEDGPPAKRTRSDQPSGPIRVGLNPADCGLDFDVDMNGLQGHALHEQGFAYCWSGARANVGIRRGKYCFGCKIVSEQVVDMSDTPSDQQHLCRVGISRGDDSVGNLGETLHSFGFGGTGKFSNAGKFSDYGEKFGVGDTIVCAVNLGNVPLATIGFSKNGKWLGVALQFDASSRGLGVVDTPLRSLPWESALFPHIMLKNVVVQLQFSTEDGLVPEEGYKPWSSAVEDGNAIIGPQFSSPKDCEVLMMVGLPASGKTTWAEKWVKEHPEKRYVLLGTNLALDLMKVPGLLRKKNYGERFERLMDRATGIFNTLLTRAAKTPRNYILDQTNVYKSARNRKLKAFVNYRKVAVVVFPNSGDLKARTENRYKEMGKEVPQDAVNEMLANYILPTSKDMPGTNEVFDEVIFPELGRDEAQRHLNEMKSALKSPNLNAKTNFSPFSRQSSIPISSVPVINKEITSAVGHWPTSHSVPLFSHHNDPSSAQVNPAYPGSIPVEHRTRSNSSYSNYTGYDTTSFQRDDLDRYGNFGESSPYMRSVSERSFSIGDTSPYPKYRATEGSRGSSFESPVAGGRPSCGYPVDPRSFTSPSAHMHDPRVPRDEFERTDFENPSSIGRSGYSYPSTPPSYSSPSVSLHVPGVPQFDHHASRAPRYEWQSPNQTSYGSPYMAHPSPRPPPGVPPANPPHGSWRR
ncbi:heterogeneous nuclear ribonucleoprotein U-like protein 1 [Iris pallida]|uniref:Heterogeneous nuclear ribonucleoprotein U-like protein 1 n=1 Tax=Iris pallida TaxID=29817 RepID=A0AAX6I8X0_IRIPA|nr:heterogeneous nuclear ribonucleoprotein U-like protein 1 [Iris pallida]